MHYLQAVLTMVVLPLASGCDNKTAPVTTTTSEGQKSEAPAGAEAAREGHALVRFVNADPSGKSRELWLNDNRFFVEVAHKSITPYTEAPSKAVRIRVREAGGLDDLATARLELFRGFHYTLAAMPRPDGSSIVVDISDDLEQPKPGKAKLRMINAPATVNDLDLYVAGTKEKIQKGLLALRASF